MEVKGVRLVPQNLEEGGAPLSWKHDQKSAWKCSDETVYRKEDHENTEWDVNKEKPGETGVKALCGVWMPESLVFLSQLQQGAQYREICWRLWKSPRLEDEAQCLGRSWQLMEGLLRN